MRPGLAALKDGGDVRLHGEKLETGFTGLEDLPHAGNGAASAYAADKGIDLPVGILPDFLGGGGAVSGGVGGVLKLLRDEGTGVLLLEFQCFVHGTFHALRARSEHQFGAEGGEELAALDGHRVGHGQDEAVAFYGGDQCQTDARVAAGRLNDQATGLKHSALLRVLDHSQGDAVFHGLRGIEELDFRQHRGAALVQTIDANQRGVTDFLKDVAVNLRHGDLLLLNFVWV